VKKWIQDRLLSIKHVVYLVRRVFSWKTTIAYLALMLVSWMSDQTLWGFLVTLTLVSLIDIVSYRQGMDSERSWKS
jgi:hypothetical protein